MPPWAQPRSPSEVQTRPCDQPALGREARGWGPRWAARRKAGVSPAICAVQYSRRKTVRLCSVQ
eukprot:1196224-Prorocentrum_minimum.AAC.3